MTKIKITKFTFLYCLPAVLAVSAFIILLDNKETALHDNTSATNHSVDQSIIQTSPLLSKSEGTQKVLGFESKHGALPSSLDGTMLNTKLEMDDSGHLILSDDIRYIFDYFLSTINEEELDTILLRIDEYLNHHLQDPALSESKVILAQYIDLKTSLFELEQEMGAERKDLAKEQLMGGQYLELLRERLNRRNTLRAQHLDPEVNEIFYQKEEAYDEYTYSRLLLNADKSLSPEARNQQVIALQQNLPEDVQISMRKSQIIDELSTKTNKILEEGGDQQQVRELRIEMFGEEAAQRFDTLDQKRVHWQSRMDTYLAERQKILDTKGLPTEAIQLQVDTLRETYFETNEQMKAKVYEKRADA